MASSQTYIELSPSRITVTRAGRGASAVVKHLDPRTWDSLWSGAPDSLTKILAPLIDQTGSTGNHATVFYQSPSLVCALFSCPAQVRDVTSAARMALAEMSSLDLTINPWCVQPLTRDRRGDPKRRHIALAADTERCVANLSSACIGAGLAGATLVPMETAMIARSIDHALDSSTDGRAMVSVHFGQSRSVIIAAYDQRLLLARRVDFGTDRLIEALSNALHATTQAKDCSSIASSVLFEHGLLRQGQTVEVGGLTLGAPEVLPAIQPVLQRMLVEIRQSVRFGLAEISAPPLVFISGAGASIARLAEAFATELQIDCVSDQTIDPQDNHDLSHARDAARRGLRVHLRPREEVVAGTVRSLRNALYAGSAAAIVLGAGHASMVMQQTEELRPQVEVLGVNALPAAPTDDFNPAQATARVRAVRSTISAIDSTVGAGTNLSALLQELCLLSADSAILTDIEFSGMAHGASCRVRGYTKGPAGDTDSTVRRLIDRLRSSPMIESVRLEGTQTSVLDDRQTQYFSATLVVRTVPYPILDMPVALSSVPAEGVP